MPAEMVAGPLEPSGAACRSPSGIARATARSRRSLPLSAAAGLLLAAGCGANMQAVYEGDMQFEHCMALDADSSLTPAIARACWTEWLAFYTYGQTRDRVRHAESRLRALGHKDVVPIEEVAQAGPEPLAAPLPASMVLAPPITGGATADAGAPAAGAASARPPPARAPCIERCGAIRAECRGQCMDRECESGCAAGFAGCAERCPP